MDFQGFEQLIMSYQYPVILIEGKRKIPKEYYNKAIELTSMLAKRYPLLRFRSGNAEGSDQAFCEGVKTVDSSRLQIFAPYKGHRKNEMIEGAAYCYPESLGPDYEAHIIEQTIKATPKNRGLIEKRNLGSSFAVKSKYLLRDTMKVIGLSDEFPPPVAAIFYADLDDIESGGTGHTIRVCRLNGIPLIFQDTWENWIISSKV